jgi:hypothetical protein
MFVRFATAAAALALMSGAAMAQSTAPQAGAPVNPDPTAAAPADQTMPADPATATSAPADPTATTTTPAPTGAATDTAGRVSSMPAEQQSALKAGDANVVSNPPIADTPENRKAYGAPLSNAGKRSSAKGN